MVSILRDLKGANRPKLLDLFCKAGGASVGYYRAGFEVEGVDIEPQPHYPFKFYLADALDFPLEGFDAYHASPPCQRWSAAFNPIYGRGDSPDLIGGIRERFLAVAKPYVIENVYKAPLRATLMLCGTMFGLDVIRHRFFEMYPNSLFSPFTCSHIKKTARQGYAPIPGKEYHVVTGHLSDIANARKAMGIDWMLAREIVEAIPPAYTEYIGKYLLQTTE